MKENQEVTKISFFKKIWYSITKFEQYPAMATEGLGRAIKYLIILTAIVSLALVVSSVIEMQKVVTNLAEYINTSVPEFSVTDGKVEMEIQEPIIIDKVQYEGIDRIVINPLAETEEDKTKAENDNSVIGTTVFFFKDQIILKAKAENEQTAKQPYTYSEFIESYTGEEIKTVNKNQVVEYLTSSNMSSFYIRYAASIFMYLLLLNIFIALLDAIEIAFLGWITTRFARMKMRFAAIYNMAVYSLTLPMILNILYIVINYFRDFTIRYFQVAYIAIAYICLTAAIFIIRDEFIKKMQQEVEKIKQEQQNVKREIEEQEKKKEEKPEDKEKEDKKEDGQDEEPQGSEA